MVRIKNNLDSRLYKISGSLQGKRNQVSNKTDKGMGMMSSNPTNLIDLVKTFQERVNQHDVDKIMTMFTEDATFEIVGLSKFAGKQQVKIIFEYDVGVNTNLQFINCKSEDNNVRCQILECNDRLDAIGISELKFSSCIFTFIDGLIQSFAAEIPPDFVEYNSKILKKFIPWLTENHPNDYSRMFMPDGRFIYNLENGRDVVPLLRKWSEEQKAHS
jgi:limonene-1,2-epoxide hydrolase